MFNTNFDYLINEYMVYCRSRQLRAKTLNSYEQALRLFERWCKEQMSIDDVAKITDSVMRVSAHIVSGSGMRQKFTKRMGMTLPLSSGFYSTVPPP